MTCASGGRELRREPRCPGGRHRWLRFSGRKYIHKGHPYYDDSWEGYAYNPAKAKDLLTAAGYADGFRIRMVYPTSGSGNMWPGPMNERLKADLKVFNIDVELDRWNGTRSQQPTGPGSRTLIGLVST